MATAIVPHIYPFPHPILNHDTLVTSGIGTEAFPEIIGCGDNGRPHKPGQLHKELSLYGAAC